MVQTTSWKRVTRTKKWWIENLLFLHGNGLCNAHSPCRGKYQRRLSPWKIYEQNCSKKFHPSTELSWRRYACIYIYLLQCGTSPWYLDSLIIVHAWDTYVCVSLCVCVCVCVYFHVCMWAKKGREERGKILFVMVWFMRLWESVMDSQYICVCECVCTSLCVCVCVCVSLVEVLLDHHDIQTRRTRRVWWILRTGQIRRLCVDGESISKCS